MKDNTDVKTEEVSFSDSGEMLPEDWEQYTNLVDAFAKAKQQQNYAVSDELRKELLEWQRQTPDDMFLEFEKTGHYIFHPWFETDLHFKKRVKDRIRHSSES